jgi:hypothetical protein
MPGETLVGFGNEGAKLDHHLRNADVLVGDEQGANTQEAKAKGDEDFFTEHGMSPVCE